MSTPFAEALVKHVAAVPYNSQLNAQISSNRTKLGTLFFDVLAKDLANLDSSSIYPPKDKESLLLLIQKIDNATPTSKRLNAACLTFYLFLDFPPELTGGDAISEYYADELDLPIGYRELIKGFWFLDQLKFTESLVHLCHPEASPTYPNEIIHMFITRNPQQQPSGYKQVVVYICANSPKLLTTQSIEYYVQTLCSGSLYSALEFSRLASPDIKPELLETIVKFCLTNPHSPSQRRNLWRLASLPLNEVESKLINEKILWNIAVSPTRIQDHDAASSLAKDILLVRALNTGDFEFAARISSLGNSDPKSSSDVQWSDLARGLALAKST